MITMFPINPLKIKQRFKDYFNPDKKIKRELELKTETIERECEMYSMKTGKKHKIQYRFTLTAIEREDGKLQFSYTGGKTAGYELDRRHDDHPIIKAVETIQDEARKSLGMPDPKKK